MDLRKIRDDYINAGLSYEHAIARTCQDVVVYLIAYSLMRIGVASTRFKDVFDVYYLLCREGVNQEFFDRAMKSLVYDDDEMREKNPTDVYRRLSSILNDRRFKRNLSNAKNNWIDANVDKVIAGILNQFDKTQQCRL